MRIEGIAIGIARLSMILLCFLLPFFFVPVAWMTVAQDKVLLLIVLLSLAAIGWIVAAFSHTSVRIPGRIVLLAAALLPLSYVISTLLSGLTTVSLVGTGIEQDTLASACLWYGALALSVVIFSDNYSSAVFALRALILGALILIVFEIAHIFYPSALTLGGVLVGQAGNPFGDWYELGIVLGFLLFSCLAFLETPIAEGLWRYLLAAIAGISFLLLIIFGIRDVWIALSVISVLFLIYHAFKKYRTHSIRSIVSWRYALWIALCVASILLAIFSVLVHSYVPERIRINSVEVRPSWQGTVRIGQEALSEPTALLFGTGPNTFTQVWGMYKPTSVNQTVFWSTDFRTGVGSVPTSFITVGVIGALGWALFILAVVWLLVRLAFLRDPLSKGAIVAESLLFASLFLLAFHVVYVPGPALSILTFMLTGLLVAIMGATGLLRMHTITLRGKGFESSGWFAGALVGCALVVLVSLGVGRAVIAESYLNHSMLVYNTTQDFAKTSALVAKSLRLYSQNDRAQRAAVELGILQFQKLANAPSQDAAAKELLRQTLQDTISHGLTAVSINGSDYQNWLALATLYNQLANAKIEGAYENAKTAYQKAIIDNPTNPLPLVQLAQLELLQQHSDLALESLKRAVALKPNLAAAYYLASQAYASKSDYQNAIPVAAQAVNYAKDDPLGWYNLGIIAYAGKDYTDAAEALQQALARQPQYANALYVLGLTYYELKRPNEAIATFEQLNTVSPNQATVTAILTNLKQGSAPFATATSTPVKKATSGR